MNMNDYAKPQHHKPGILSTKGMYCVQQWALKTYFTYTSADAKLFSSVTVSYCLLHAWNHKRESR